LKIDSQKCKETSEVVIGSKKHPAHLKFIYADPARSTGLVLQILTDVGTTVAKQDKSDGVGSVRLDSLHAFLNFCTQTLPN